MAETNLTNEKDFIKGEKTALVVIDLQDGIVNRDLKPYTGKEVVSNTTKLIDVVKEKGGFVVLVRVSTTDGKDMPHPKTDLSGNNFVRPEGWDEYIPELKGIDKAHYITKRQWGAFYGTDLDLQLRRRGIENIILCGISTGIGVDTTAREAYQRGYNQIFVEDAMTALSKEEHDFVTKNIFPRMGKIRKTENIESMIK
ncbi:isochorismatase family protein [Clostridium thermobutyricum]|uniref:isochorismatase family protein n=1 Tax=Clostridium thermobutyricum TaxID=29372 RepID=UPI002941BEFE|nr:isochorismatase family protein [Clostridium thermobutyricum]